MAQKLIGWLVTATVGFLWIFAAQPQRHSPLLAQAPKTDTLAVAQRTDKGVVVCVSPIAAEIGATILRRGGNAVDAAIAVAFALAVAWPEAGNIGGGGFMMVAPPRQPVVCLEFRETAPQAAPVDLLPMAKSARGRLRQLEFQVQSVV
jgi:gamma-glutamyltranspeptidase/glutathione hydrolase